ncbi:MAG: DUF1800 domain-containing protein [Flavobacteriales bacterium]|nr:MAG: DUF1800 domain-containing protein [Flavobacteriales bacterium]
MDKDQRELVNHLYGRAGFGLRPVQLEALMGVPYAECVDRLFPRDKAQPLVTEVPTATLKQYRAMTEKEQRAFRRAQRQGMARLNEAWCKRLAGTHDVFREKMTLFWHGHFACRSKWGRSAQLLNNAIREHALGRFGDLLMAVSKSAAMLEFLDNQQNRKGAPNENFAREVMELFTLGRGHYTEQDIKEAARAFTGWSFELVTGEFKLNADQHDDGPKTFRGRTGNWGGEDILGFLLEDERTATFICGKIYKWFVSPKEDAAFVAEMARRFRGSGLDIGHLMRFVFLSEHFQQARQRGARVKNPVELLAGLEHLFGLGYGSVDHRITLQRALGQVLFHPPSVAGWAEGVAWIDSNSTLLRLRLPSILVNNGELDWEPNGNDPEGLDQMMMDAQGDQPGRDAKGRLLQVTNNRDALLAELPRNVSNEELCALLLCVPPSHTLLGIISIPSNADLLQRVLQVVSSPEYQLC